MDYKTFVSSMTAGDMIGIITDTTLYDNFLEEMGTEKAIYFYTENIYSVILSASITDTQIVFTYYNLEGQYIQKTINR